MNKSPHLPKRNLTPDILKAHAEGMVNADIAVLVNCSPANVSKTLSRRGLRNNRVYLNSIPKPPHQTQTLKGDRG